MSLIRYEYVYLLKNECMPGVYKIGMTKRDVCERIKELNNSTSIPTPFEEVISIKVENAYEVEQELHEQYEKYRINANKEFFKFNDEILNDVINSYLSYELIFIKEVKFELDKIIDFSSINTLNWFELFVNHFELFEDYTISEQTDIYRNIKIPNDCIIALIGLIEAYRKKINLTERNSNIIIDTPITLIELNFSKLLRNMQNDFKIHFNVSLVDSIVAIRDEGIYDYAICNELIKILLNNLKHN